MSKPNSSKEKSFFGLYDRFVADSRRGRRLQPNGKKFSAGTIDNYVYTRQLLGQFCKDTDVELRIRPLRLLNQREREVEKNYWKKFYRRFTDYCFQQCGYFDNYVGQSVKNLKVFFNYLNKDLAMGVGDFHRSFYVYKEEIQIHPLLPEELHYLVYNFEFENSLSPRMKEVKDFFTFGCTVA